MRPKLNTYSYLTFPSIWAGPAGAWKLHLTILPRQINLAAGDNSSCTKHYSHFHGRHIIPFSASPRNKHKKLNRKNAPTDHGRHITWPNEFVGFTLQAPTGLSPKSKV